MSDESVRRILASAVWDDPRTTLRRFTERVRDDLMPGIKHPGHAALDAARQFVRQEQKWGHFYDPSDGKAIQFFGPFIGFEEAGLGVTEAQGGALNTFLAELDMYALVEWPDADVHRVDRQRRAVLECAEILLGAVSLSLAPVEAVGKGDGRSDDQAALRLLSVFTNSVADERISRATTVLEQDNLTANEKLAKIDDLIPLPATASSEQLGQLLGVTKQAVMKTDWWKLNRKGEKASEIGRRRDRHQERGKQHEPIRPTDEDE